MNNAQKMAIIIIKLAKEKGVSVNKLVLESGAGKGLLDRMKIGQEPSITKLIHVADYFDVSLDYLTGRSDNPQRL